MTEQVNVPEPVAETEVQAQTGPKTMAEVARMMVLAGIGAAAIARDEAKALMEKLIERGTAAQADVKKTAEDLAERSKHMASDVAERSKEQGEQAQSALEKQVETVLGKLNIPSKNDLNQLNARLDALSAKIDATMGEAPADKTSAVPAGDSPVI